MKGLPSSTPGNTSRYAMTVLNPRLSTIRIIACVILFFRSFSQFAQPRMAICCHTDKSRYYLRWIAMRLWLIIRHTTTFIVTRQTCHWEPTVELTANRSDGPLCLAVGDCTWDGTGPRKAWGTVWVVNFRHIAWQENACGGTWGTIGGVVNRCPTENRIYSVTCGIHYRTIKVRPGCVTRGVPLLSRCKTDNQKFGTCPSVLPTFAATHTEMTIDGIIFSSSDLVLAACINESSLRPTTQYLMVEWKITRVSSLCQNYI